MTTAVEAFEMGRLDFHSGLHENPFAGEAVAVFWQDGHDTAADEVLAADELDAACWADEAYGEMWHSEQEYPEW